MVWGRRDTPAAAEASSVALADLKGAAPSSISIFRVQADSTAGHAAGPESSAPTASPVRTPTLYKPWHDSNLFLAP